MLYSKHYHQLEKVYFDAAYGQKSDKKIIGLFVVGEFVNLYDSLSKEETKETILKEIDSLFSDHATPSYFANIYQNWNKEPFIRGGYLSDHSNWKLVKRLGESVNSKLYFAGGANKDAEDWVSVHVAAASARRVVSEINHKT